MSLERSISAFAGFNLLQSAFTGFCPVGVLLHKLGVKTEREQGLLLSQ